YNDITPTMPTGPIPLEPAQPVEWTERMALEDKLRDSLQSVGFNEAVTYSLVSATAHTNLVVDDSQAGLGLLSALSVKPVKLANAMTEEQEYLRTSLLPSLLSVYASNRHHAGHGLWFFEAGRIYWPRPKDLPEEKKILGLLVAGLRLPEAWQAAG